MSWRLEGGWNISMPKKILVIEDDDVVQEYLIEWLELEGYIPQSAENGLEGLRLLHKFMPDIIISDIYMPDMDGIKFLNFVRNDPVTSAIPVIMLSGSRKYEDIRACLNLGADDYLTKPFIAEDLRASIEARFRRQDQILGNSSNGPIKVSKRIIHHIFLSYSHQDTLVMQQIKNHFSDEYLRIWTDENLEPGTAVWEDSIEDAIKSSGCLVVALSPDAKQSKWVKRELAFAELCGVHVFPVLIRGEPNEVIPLSLINSQWVDIRGNFEIPMKRLVNKVREHVGIHGSVIKFDQ